MEKTFAIAQDKSATVAELPRACADEAAALEFMERTRWGDSPCCPRCGSVDVYKMLSRAKVRIRPFNWRCRDCKRTYSVRTGTVMEESLIPLRIWCYAFWRASASKKGISALQVKRETGLNYRSALFLLHRIRYAMAPDHEPAEKLHGTVEADETYVGGKPRYRGVNKRGGKDKAPVFAVVQRGGEVRARTVADVTAKTLQRALRECVSLPDARLITDESWPYMKIGREFGSGHEHVNHGRREYVRGDVHSNTIESFFAILKRQLYGTHHAVSRKHLHRYVAECEFRYNHRHEDDGARTLAAVRQADGKRLKYKDQVGRGPGVRL